MDYGRIKALRQAFETDELSWGELAEINDAFDTLVASGATLRDEPVNATITDQLDELELHATTVEKVIYEWVLDKFGENEANDPSWSTRSLAKDINNIQIIFGTDNGKIKDLLDEHEY